MNAKTIFDRDILILDGALGTMLQTMGLQTGQSPMVMNLTAPEAVKRLHLQYLEAGSHIVAANTFGAGEAFGRGEDASASFTAAVKLAKEAAVPYGALVAADIGPIGRLLEPMGNLTADGAYELFVKQVRLAEAAGADILFFETFTDLLEIKLGVLAAKAETRLPVFASMSFEASGRTFLGCGLASMALTLQAAGADALGLNCSVGPEESYAMAAEIVKWTGLPVIVKPNAGLPVMENGVAVYNVSPSDFAAKMATLTDLGVGLLGGCCGTTPAYISALAKALHGKKPAPRPAADTAAVCSASLAVSGGELDRTLDCRVSPEAMAAYAAGDIDALTELAMDCEGDILVLCASGAGGDERALLKGAVTELQSLVRKPLRIESGDPGVTGYIDRYYRGKL